MTSGGECIRRSIFNKYRSFDSSCKAREIVDIFRVHMRRVTESVFCLYRKIYSLVYIAYSYDGKNGHHQFVLNERMRKFGFAYYASYIV